jgi:hypothetical protein
MPPSQLTPARRGAEALVNTFTSDRQELSSVTALKNGGYVVTWQSLNQTGDNGWGVFAQRFNADGSKAGSETHVNTTLGDHQAGATAVAGPGGACTILWTSFQGATNDVMAQRYDAAGAKLGGEFAIAASTTLHEQGVNAVALADGGFVVSYGLYDASGRTEMAQRFDANWNALGSAFAASKTFTPGGGSAVLSQGPAALTALNNGRLVSVWTQAEAGDTYTDVWAEILTASGSVVGSPFRVNTVVNQAQGQPAVATLKDGGFVVTFYSGDAGGTVFQRFAANGSKLGGEVRVDNTPNGAVTPSITALADGGFVIAWQGGADGDGSAVSAQRFAADGSALGDNFLLETQTTAYQTEPALAQLANGKLVATWSSEAFGNATDIAMQQFYLPQALLPKANANNAVRVTMDDASYGDSAFAHASGLTAVNNTGGGNLSYTLGAQAEAAFAGGVIKLSSGANAASFIVDASGLSASASTIIILDHGTSHIIGGAGDDTFRMNAFSWGAGGWSIDGGGGVNTVRLTFTGTLYDGDFAGLSNMTELDLMAGSDVIIALGATAAAAFGPGGVKLVAKAGATIEVHGQAMTAGFSASGADGNDTFIGGIGSDVLKGGAGADLFMLGLGGADRILDFTVGEDHIDFTLVSAMHSLDDVSMRMAGSDALLTFAGQSVRLKGVDFHSLSASDFIFT